MKIVAKTKDGVLVEANESEIAALHGFTSHYDSAYKREGKMDVGYELPVAEAREAMQFVRAWSANRLTDAQRAVKSMSDSLEKIGRIFPPK